MYVLALVKVSAPVPSWASEPEPVTTPANVTLSERSKTSAPWSVTLPVTEPAVPPAPIWSVAPPAIFAPPVKVFAPVRTTAPAAPGVTEMLLLPVTATV